MWWFIILVIMVGLLFRHARNIEAEVIEQNKYRRMAEANRDALQGVPNEVRPRKFFTWSADE